MVDSNSGGVSQINFSRNIQELIVSVIVTFRHVT